MWADFDNVLEHFRGLLDSREFWEAQEIFRQEVWMPTLQECGFQEMDIKLGETEANANMHEILCSERSEFQEGKVAKIILPGVCRANDRRVEKKALVIRADRP